MNRKDFRPNNSNITFSKKDRDMIREERKGKASIHEEKYSKQIKGEHEASKEYSDLAKKNPSDSKKLKEISGEEKTHAKELSTLSKRHENIRPDLNKYNSRRKDVSDAYLYDAFESREDALNSIKDSGYKGYVRKGNYGDNGRLKYGVFLSEKQNYYSTWKLSSHHKNGNNISEVYEKGDRSIELFRDSSWNNKNMNVIIRDKSKPSYESSLGKVEKVKYFDNEYDARTYANTLMKY